jgi:ATP-dependent Clp protease ATP-binding subunit ClpC
MPQASPPFFQELLASSSDIAQARGQKPSTAHLLLALLVRGGQAAELMVDRGLSEATVRTAIKFVGDEPRDAIIDVEDGARRIARDCGDKNVGPLHALAALARQPHTAAFRALTEGGCNVPALRNAALATIAASRWPRRVERASSAPRAMSAPAGDGGERPSPHLPPRAPIAHAPPPPAPRPATPEAPPARGIARQASPAARRVTPPLLRTPPKGRGRPPQRPVRLEPSSLSPTAPPPAPTAAATASPTVSPHELDTKQFPWLTSLGKNLSTLAAQGKLDPLVGRGRELEQVLDVLAKRRANNPCLVGPPGVGKTAIAEGLAQVLTRGSAGLGGPGAGDGPRVVVELPMGEILAGTHLRGTLSERLSGIRKEVESAGGRVIVFFDEIHTLVGASGDGADASNELKSSLARGALQCVGATTEEEYRKHFEADAALARRFTRIDVDEPSEEDAVKIVDGLLGRYAAHHGVAYEGDAAAVAVKWSARYIVERKLPDKAVGVLDLAGARAFRRRHRKVGRQEIAAVVSDLADVPVERLLCSDAERLLAIEKQLAGEIVGHAGAIERIATTLRRNAAGFRSRRPIGSFLFLGPTGVGKTETARAIARFLYPGGTATTHLDMSEYAEAHALARLVGAPPGYVGHEEGGQLTEALRRRPYQLVLLDEIEKAHRDVQQSLLQVLDEGRLTDGRGRTVDFSNAVVVMTSNLGSDAAAAERSARRIGFGDAAPGDAGRRAADEGAARRALEEAKKALPIELWNRIDETLYFAPLSRAEIAQVAGLLLAGTAASLDAEHGAALSWTDAAVDLLIASGGWDPALGARPMRRTIQKLVEGPLADAVLRGRLVRGTRALLTALDGRLDLRLSSKPARARSGASC